MGMKDLLKNGAAAEEELQKKATNKPDKVATSTSKAANKPNKVATSPKQTPKTKKGTNIPKEEQNALKQIFSFQAKKNDIDVWKIYAKALGVPMAQVGTMAFNEYMNKHPLSEQQQAVFKALMNIK